MNFERLEDKCLEKFNCDVCLTRYVHEEKSCWISMFISNDKNKGNGTRCMKHIIRNLKRRKMKSVRLVASPLPYVYGDNGQAQCKLMKWYERFGFKNVDANEMELVLSD